MRYDDILLAIQAVSDPDAGYVPNLGNAAAILKEYLPDVNWTGFYLLRGDELILGPFSGRVACVRIRMGRGVCGTAAKKNKTQLVFDVHSFPGHIVCDPASRSEVVVPLRTRSGDVLGVLDVDSPVKARFNADDVTGLEQVARLVETFLWKAEDGETDGAG